MIDLTKHVLAGLLKLKDRIPLVEVPDHYTPAFTLDTVAGKLTVTPMDDWLACRFEDVVAAAKHCPTHDAGGRFNPYSGKWNWHWFEFMTAHSQDQTRLNMTSGVDNMLEAFADAVEKLLPVPPVVNTNHRYRQPKLSPRELATVIAALRAWSSDMTDPAVSLAVDDIASDGGTLEPLCNEEINKLCERLNP